MSDDRRWRLIRLDDNHNEVVVDDFSRYADAEAAKTRFEGRGHKQSWFVTRVH
jgi:hypothetical protein